MREQKKTHIFLASPHMSEEGFEQKYIKEAFDTNWIAPLGKNVTQFEREMCAKLGAKAATALSSGTAAIHMALKMAGVSQGDLVFCQSLTFAATANPIRYERAIPVFIDSEESTWNMSPEALEKAFERYRVRGKKPKAVIVVHLYGLCAKIEEILNICKKYQVPLIEDAAESLGTICKMNDGEERYTGTIGDFGIISFNGNKIITSSGGGMLLFNSSNAKEQAAKVVFWSTQARDKARWYQHSETGYNYRMSNIVAGIGRGQLHILDQRVEQKRIIYNYYRKNLIDYDSFSLMPIDRFSKSNCWLSVLRISESCPVQPLALIMALEKEDIESRPVWKPLHLQPVFADCDFVSEEDEIKERDVKMLSDSSIAGKIFGSGVCLPSDTKMQEKELQRVCEVLRRGIKNRYGI